MTIKDIAKKLGYSVSVVSRALNPSPDKSSTVSEQTRQKIRAAVAKMNYTPNYAASCISRRKHPAIGIFMPTFCRSLICDAINGISQVATENNLALNLYFGGSTDLARFLRTVTHQQNLGIIVYYSEHLHHPGEFARLLREFCQKDGKVVLFNTAPPDERFQAELASGRMVVLKFDDYDGGRQAAAHLHQQACAEYFVLSLASVYYQERARGFCDYLHERGITAVHENLPLPTPDIHADRACLRAALQRHLGCKPLGLFVPSDYHALDVLGIMSSLGWQTGRDFHLVSYNKCDFLNHVNHDLASLEQDFFYAGFRAMQMLTAMLNCEPVTSELIKTKVAIFKAD
ncbi:MAG: LacI family transcriptional regulator [Lentisphaerae bacterium]|nr:LacI family transcriptional regulator [Lentisphaerota bacterium]OQC15063.1 MAG: putative HTH-type transcriptional repressor ExuR [Lentisphaerae bacterium ADurb.Bin082]